MAWGAKIMKVKKEPKVLAAIIMIIVLVGFGYAFLVSGGAALAR